MHYLYKITNQVNSKIYIGQSIDPDKRWKKHLAYSKQENKPQYIHRAIAKYGVAYFLLEIIATCQTQEDADATEIQLILQYDSRNPDKGYNLCRGGEGGWFGKKHTEESKEKNRQAHLGTVASEETKKKQSETMKEKCANGWMPVNIKELSALGVKARKGLSSPNIGKYKLSAEQVEQVKQLLSTGMSQTKIAKIMGCSRTAIRRWI